MNNLISRHIIKEQMLKYGFTAPDMTVTEFVEDCLPPAQPDLDEWCTDCKEYDPEKHSCPRFNRIVRETVEEIKGQQPEIIRCGECKNRKTDDCPMYYEETVEWDDGDGYIEVDYVPHDRTVDDGFCFMAERKADP